MIKMFTKEWIYDKLIVTNEKVYLLKLEKNLKNINSFQVKAT